jgi:OOP family OmpA-OmpF porin
MKIGLRGATALAAAMLAAPAAAHATEGWYGKVDALYSFDGSFKVAPATTQLVAPILGGNKDLADNWGGDVGLGYATTGAPRFELELGDRFNKIKGANLGASKVHAYTAMLNGILDFNKTGMIQPYAGLGVGYGETLVKMSTPGAVPNQVARGTDGGFAWQGLLGLGFRLSQQLTADLGYRYLNINDRSARFLSTSPAAGGKIKSDYDQQAVSLGLRFQFAAPPPPPPPPAPPPPPPVETPPPVQVCPVSDFKVYFEWDRSNLNQAAVDTINNAVAAAKNCNVSTVNVTGFTDTSGSPKYNQALSERRAQVVTDALVAGGIPAGVVTSAGKGETELDKATKDGVREPLNRRSAVTISFR